MSKLSRKESVELRNTIFLEHGLPALKMNGFKNSPFTTSWFGRDNLRGYSYELCRVSAGSILEIVTIHIMYDERWIQEHINVFKLEPSVTEVSELEGKDGLQFHLTPNSISNTRLAPPRGIIFAGMPQHKLRFFITKRGLAKRVAKLAKLIATDLTRIDYFIELWHKEFKPITVDWEGRNPHKRMGGGDDTPPHNHCASNC